MALLIMDSLVASVVRRILEGPDISAPFVKSITYAKSANRTNISTFLHIH